MIILILLVIGLIAYFIFKLKPAPYHQILSQQLKATNYHYRLIESIQLKKEPTVTRKKDTLHFKLRNGRYVSLNDNLEEGWGTYRKFSFMLYLKAIHYYLVDCTFYEGGSSVLVHDHTGHITYVDGIPLISPDNRRFLTASYDESGFSGNGLTIYRLRKDGLTEEWSDTDGAEAAIWMSDHKIQYIRVSYKPTKHREKITVELHHGRWKEIERLMKG